MKIAFIGQKGIPAKIGGVERHVEELATRLCARGHEVFVYVRNNYTEKNLAEYKGVKLIHLPSIPTKHLDALSHTFLATMHALFCRYDVVHYQAIGPSFLSWIIKLLKRQTVLIATFHCQDYFHQKWGWFARTSLRLGEYVTCVVPHKTIVVSNTLKAYVKNTYAKEPVVIPNGFTAEPTNETTELSKWNLQKNEYVLSVSRLIKHKGIHYLIEAFKNLEDQNRTRGKKLVIAGEGFHTDKYVAYLKNISLGRPNIIFTGAQTGETLSQLFSHAYAFVQPSETEGLSITLLEAMGYGKAIIASNIPENMEALSSNGSYFENGDANSLTQKLSELLENQELAVQLGKAAQVAVNEKYSWKKIVSQTEVVYVETQKRRANFLFKIHKQTV